jgi:hypothetical protein
LNGRIGIDGAHVRSLVLQDVSDLHHCALL